MIKKLFLGVFAFSLLLASHANASAATLPNGCYGTAAYSITTGQKCPVGKVLGDSISVSDTKTSDVPQTRPALGTTDGPSGVLDPTPRIAYWYGKVNQHVDAQGNWLTDPDGISGADLDKLKYCQKWYPSTTSVQDYQMETINGWRERGNVGGPYTASVMTTKCVQDTVTPTVISPMEEYGYSKQYIARS